MQFILGDEDIATVARGGSEGDETYSLRCRPRPTVSSAVFAMGSENHSRNPRGISMRKRPSFISKPGPSHEKMP